MGSFASVTSLETKRQCVLGNGAAIVRKWLAMKGGGYHVKGNIIICIDKISCLADVKEVRQ